MLFPCILGLVHEEKQIGFQFQIRLSQAHHSALRSYAQSRLSTSFVHERSVIVEWLYDLRQDFQVEWPVFFGAVRLFDAFLTLSPAPITIQSYQLVAATCFSLACKVLDEDYPGDIHVLRQLSAGVCKPKEIGQTEWTILKVLCYQINLSNVWSLVVLLMDTFPFHCKSAQMKCVRLAFAIQFHLHYVGHSLPTLAVAIYWMGLELEAIHMKAFPSPAFHLLTQKRLVLAFSELKEADILDWMRALTETWELPTTLVTQNLNRDLPWPVRCSCTSSSQNKKRDGSASASPLGKGT
jgi:hypothetical protein